MTTKKRSDEASEPQPKSGIDRREFLATTAVVGGGNKMDVVGSLKEGSSTIMLDGYCLFEGKLTKK